MNRTRTVVTTLFLALMLALLAGLSVQLPQGAAHAQDPDRGAPAQGIAAPQAMVGTGFTYQGRLEDGGSPANGQYDFHFSLHDHPTVDSPVAGPVTLDDYDVVEGLFTAQLDFGQVFTGTARYLQVGVRPGASTGAYTHLTPRQELTPVPYALALPGLWTQQNAVSHNVLGGFGGNWIPYWVYGGTIGGGGETGFPNRVASNFGTVAGGVNNAANGPSSAVGGGDDNQANGLLTVVAGGYFNRADLSYATVSGGQFNTASDEHATIGGGSYNEAGGFAATVSGGYNNRATADYATIGGGGCLDCTYNNRVTGDNGTVGGGFDNQAGHDDGTTAYGTVGGGYDNKAQGNDATIGGGAHNSAVGSDATVGGGWDNEAIGDNATVAGGWNNSATGDHASVGGGYSNSAGDAYASVGGGWVNDAGGERATVAGGYSNDAAGWCAAIGGGNGNIASGAAATIGGGQTNHATDYYATTSGGGANVASNYAATVGGGEFNQATGTYATVGGGTINHATGNWATVPGGSSNAAQGNYSFAAGNQAKANNVGCFVWGDSTTGDIACNNDNRTIFRSTGGFYIYTNSALNAGSRLLAGGSAWGSVSARDLKQNFAAVDTQALLARLTEIPITTWNYKAQDPSIRHIGPMAEDFNALLEDLGGEGEGYINSLDADGVALAAIQGLYAQNEQLRAQVNDLEARLAALERGGASPSSALGLHTWLLLGGLVLAGGLILQRRRTGGEG